VSPSLNDTLVLQPNQNPNEVTIAGNNSGLEGSNPTWVEILAATWTTGSELLQVRNAFEFNLSNIPANATIESATLSLYSNPNPRNGDLIHANYGPDNTMLVQRITTPWQADNVTWANQPSSTTEDQTVIASTKFPIFGFNRY
jgi:hypothetical protein